MLKIKYYMLLVSHYFRIPAKEKMRKDNETKYIKYQLFLFCLISNEEKETTSFF